VITYELQLERPLQYLERIDRRIFSFTILFRNGSITGGPVSRGRICRTEPPRLIDERDLKNTDAVLILMIGALVFAFYQFHPAPVFFNSKQVDKVMHSSEADSFAQISSQYQAIGSKKKPICFRPHRWIEEER
jgi:hypothetical protein